MDGAYRAKTANAVSRFQLMNGLKADEFMRLNQSKT
ncbi:peptidoglycan-binding protein [Bacillus velezensis]|nr:hypothetical protein CU084_06600 [Bacillus velezensis]